MDYIIDKAEPPLIDIKGGSTHILEVFFTIVTILDHILNQSGSNFGVLIGASKSAHSTVGYLPEDAGF
jgi:hypothetical protein